MCCTRWMEMSNRNRYGLDLSEHMKLRIRKDLGRWSRKLLFCLGLENIGKHIVGDAKWEKLYDGGSSTEEQAPQDFEPEPDKTPPQTERVAQNCGRSRKGTTPIRSNYQQGQVEDDEEDEEIEEGEIDEGVKTDDVNHEAQDQGQPETKSLTSPLQEEEGENEDIMDEEKMPEQSKTSEAEDEKEEEDGEEKQNSIMEEGEEEENEGKERKEMGNENERDSSESTPNSPQPDRIPNDTENMESPSPSDGVSGEEKGSGALSDNLFQILPYWYFLNRAFGLPGEGEGAGTGGNPFPTPQSDEMDQNDEDVEGDDDEGEGSSEGGHRSSPQYNSRLNSLLLLESLRQQLQNQGTQVAVPNEHVLQQGMQLSEILSKMSGTTPGSTSHSTSSQWRATPQSPSSTAVENEVDDQPLDLTSSKKRDDSVNKIGFRRVGEYSGAFGNDKQTDLPSPFLLDEHTSKVFRSNPRSSKGYTAQELQAALHDIQSGKLGTRRAAVIYGIPRSTLRNKVYKLGKDRGRLFPNQNGPHHHNNNNSVNHNNNIQGKEAVPAPNVGLLGKLSYLQGLNASSYLQRTTSRFIGSDEGEEEQRRPPFLREPPSLYAVNNGGRDDTNNTNDKPGPPKLLRGKSSLSELISKHHAQTQRTLHLHHPTSYQNQMGMEMEETSPSGGESNEPPTLLSQQDWKSHLLNQHHQQQREAQSSSSNQRHHLHHLHPSQHHLHQQSNEDPSSLDLAGKKSRPKRGKYRNYDREALVKAVRAVQNGEMSVHRAGSFFGVPHSTLEYKVKERHLLRRPKRKEVTSPISQTKSSPENSSDATPSSRSFPPSATSASSFYSKTPSKGISSSSSPYLFPLTSDLRESLSRYLNSEQQDNRSDSHSEMEVGPSPLPHDDAPATAPTSRKEEGSFALEGLIGSRLSSLFQLNDMLIRSSSGGTETLDLSKK